MRSAKELVHKNLTCDPGNYGAAGVVTGRLIYFGILENYISKILINYCEKCQEYRTIKITGQQFQRTVKHPTFSCICNYLLKFIETET